MQSSGLVLWLLAVACACDPCLASPSGHQRSRQTLLTLVRRARALTSHPPAPHSPQIPALPAEALLEFSRPFRLQHVAPDVQGGSPFRGQPGQQPAEQQQQPALPEDAVEEMEEGRRAWAKRGPPSDAPVSGGAGEGQEEAVAAGLQQVGASIASSYLRHARSGPRPYDVPRIGESNSLLPCSLSCPRPPARTTAGPAPARGRSGLCVCG